MMYLIQQQCQAHKFKVLKNQQYKLGLIRALPRAL